MQPNVDTARAIAATPGPALSPAVSASQVQTGYSPTPGVQAGSVRPAGGLVQEGLPRTAGVAAGVAAQAYARQAEVRATGAVAAGQQMDPAIATPQSAPAGAAARGPAAWNEGWAKRFAEAGLPSSMIQQLSFSGANGADAAELQKTLDQVKGEVDTTLAKFQHDHPEEYKKLRAAPTEKLGAVMTQLGAPPSSQRAMLFQIAQAVQGKAIKQEQLHELAEQAGMTMGKMALKQFLLPMAAYSLIPGYGLWRMLASPLTGGKDFVTGEKIKLDPINLLMAAGGAATMWNVGRGIQQISQANKVIAGGGDAALVAAREGVKDLSGLAKLKSYVPGTQLNKSLASLSSMTDDLDTAIKSMPKDSIERALAQLVKDKWVSGEIGAHRTGGVRFGKMGFMPNARGSMPMIGQRSKAMITTTLVNGRPTLVMDGRMTGKSLAAHLASVGVEFADDALKRRMLIANGMPASAGQLSPQVTKLLREAVLGNATKQMLAKGTLVEPGVLGKAWGMWRPGPLQDALTAAKQVTNGTVGAPTGFKKIPMLGRVGIIGSLGAGAAYMFAVKPQLDAAKKAQAEAAKEQAKAAKEAAAQGGGAAAGGQPTAEQQQLMQQFAALPPQQQAALIQEQTTKLQQAAAKPNVSPQEQAAIQAGAAELELLKQAAAGGGAPAAAGAAAPASGAAAPAGAGSTPAATATPPAGGAGNGGYTARGLGLAPAAGAGATPQAQQQAAPAM